MDWSTPQGYDGITFQQSDDGAVRVGLITEMTLCTADSDKCDSLWLLTSVALCHRLPLPISLYFHIDLVTHDDYIDASSNRRPHTLRVNIELVLLPVAILMASSFRSLLLSGVARPRSRYDQECNGVGVAVFSVSHVLHCNMHELTNTQTRVDIQSTGASKPLMCYHQSPSTLVRKNTSNTFDYRVFFQNRIHV